MIYIVEDDADIREMESYALKNSGFDVREFANAAALFDACETELPSLILLDIMLPGIDGLTALCRLREDDRTSLIPIMMVTAKTTEIDRVRGLDSGADDYLIKPFGILELVSRVKALLRRVAPREPDSLCYGEIELNSTRRTVTAAGKAVELTYKEFELLRYLLKNKGIVVTRENLMDRVWGLDFEGESRTVDAHIKTLRQKLGDGGQAIKTIRNVGYKIGD